MVSRYSGETKLGAITKGILKCTLHGVCVYAMDKYIAKQLKAVGEELLANTIQIAEDMGI